MKENKIFWSVLIILTIMLGIPLGIDIYRNAQNNSHSLYQAAQVSNVTPIYTPTPAPSNAAVSVTAVDQSVSATEQQVEIKLNNLDSKDVN